MAELICQLEGGERLMAAFVAVIVALVRAVVNTNAVQ